MRNWITDFPGKYSSGDPWGSGFFQLALKILQFSLTEKEMCMFSRKLVIDPGMVISAYFGWISRKNMVLSVCCFEEEIRGALDCQTVSIAAVADGYKCKPPREVTFPIRPQVISVGLFTAAILYNRSGVDKNRAD